MKGPSTVSGTLPNVHVGAASIAQLRNAPFFFSLPPVDTLLLSTPPSYRYVRQEDPLWGTLHAGMCTTSNLAAALGLLEPGAAKRLRLPKQRASHGHLLEAYLHLCRGNERLIGGEDSSDGCKVTDDEEEMRTIMVHNATTTAKYNAGKRLQSQAEVQHIAGSSSKEPRFTHRAPMVVEANPPMEVIHENECEIAAAAAAAITNNILDGDSLEEALRMPRPMKGKTYKKKSKSARKTPNHASVDGAMNGLNGQYHDEEAAKLKRARSLSGQGVMAVCCAWGIAQEAATLWGLNALFPASSVVEVGLCVLGDALPSEWGFPRGSLPPIGASPDALVYHLGGGEESVMNGTEGTSRTRGGGGGGCSTERGDDSCIDQNSEKHLRTIHDLSLEFAKVSLDLFTQQPQPQRKNPFGLELDENDRHSEATGPCWEVVEVKNVCPFAVPPPHRCHGKRRFVVRDRGPALALSPLWIPQLQFHMLCANTRSALLVSRSLLHGVRVFRVARNDAYLLCMLRVLSTLWTKHVVPRRPPPKDAFSEMKEHAELVRLTRVIASEARLVAEASAEAIAVPGADQRFFLD